MPISESDKLGLTGCHFVPIKKRRFLFNSPSSPPRGPPMSDSALSQGSNPASLTADVASADGIGQHTDVGVSILADAACNNSLGRGGGSVELGPSIRDLPANETSPQILSKDESNFSFNGLSGRPSSVNGPSEGTRSGISKGLVEICKASSKAHTEAADQDQDHLSKDEGTVRTPDRSSRIDRLHWDLNLPMEEWGFPSEVSDPQTNIVQGSCVETEHVNLNYKMEVAEGDYLQSTPGVFIAETEKALPSVTQGLKDSDKLECNVNASIKVEETVLLPEKEKPMSFDIRSSSTKEIVTEIKLLDPHQTNRGDGHASSYSVIHAPKPSKSTNEDHSQCVSLGSTGSTGASSLPKIAQIGVYKSDKMVSPHLKDESEPTQVGDKNVHAIKISSHGNSDNQIDGVSGAKSKCNSRYSALTARPSASGSKDNIQRSYTSDIADNCEILNPKERLKFNEDSDTLENGAVSARIQQAVDSSWEDGELRDSDEPPWEERDVEDTEAELVDYGSDGEVYSFNAAVHPIDMSEGAVQKNHQMAALAVPKAVPLRPSKQISVRGCQISDDAAPLAGKKLDRGHKRVKDNVVSSLVDKKTREASGDRSPESLKSSINTGVRGYNNKNNWSVGGIDAKSSEAGVFQSRAIRREWQPRINGQTNQGLLKKDRQHEGRFRDYDDSLRHVGEWGNAKSFRTGTDSRHNHFPSWKANQCIDKRGLKRRLSPTNPLPTDSRERGQESNNSVLSRRASNYGRVRLDGDGQSDNLTWTQTSTTASHGADGPIRRNRSPVERSRNVGTRPAEKLIDGSVTDSRVGYIRRYGSRGVDDKGRRGQYHEPVSEDCIAPSSNYSNQIPSGEKYFLPVGRRRDLHADTKSPSRPRTRSPHRWQSPKGRNVVDRSRSPDVRSRGRARSPHQQGEGYPISRAKRPPSQQWTEDRVEAGGCRAMDHKHHSSPLDRRSPSRNFSSSKTLNIGESQQRLNQTDYSRPVNPGRLNRGRPQEGSSDGRRQNERYRTVDTLRRHDIEDENSEKYG